LRSEDRGSLFSLSAEELKVEILLFGKFVGILFVVKLNEQFGEIKKRERVLVYLTTHGYVRRVSRPPTAAYCRRRG
jgi:hypothetical protein